MKLKNGEMLRQVLSQVIKSSDYYNNNSPSNYNHFVVPTLGERIRYNMKNFKQEQN